MYVVHLILKSLWFILPAYVANGTPVLLGGGPPMDFGRKFFDGRRILGDGKTWRGFLVGLIAGAIVGILQGRLEAGLFLSLGALIGDFLGSFFKRRWGLKSGALAPGLDQLEFLVAALVLVSIVESPTWRVVAVLLIITPAIHLSTNFLSYKLGFSSSPY
ncbi:MAG: CDP-2,3-bis-(O-geranylgeranyl)-sn-glycerol synthase [Candidatus Hadarchaeia archaeon]